MPSLSADPTDQDRKFWPNWDRDLKRSGNMILWISLAWCYAALVLYGTRAWAHVFVLYVTAPFFRISDNACGSVARYLREDLIPNSRIGKAKWSAAIRLTRQEIRRRAVSRQAN